MVALRSREYDPERSTNMDAIMPSNVFRTESVDEIVRRVRALLSRRPRVVIAIDGNCCAGKTTLAARLSIALRASVFHMDDYFLPPHLRTRERLGRPGGNVDAERFLSEVLQPVLNGSTVFSRRYDCREDALLPAVEIVPSPVAIVEGAYSLHPLLFGYYDLKLFCRVDAVRQAERVRARNGKDALPMFLKRWIPLENAYFDTLHIAERCDLIIDTSSKT